MISQLVIQDTKQGNFNSASAMSTLIFLLIFAVAFIMVKFLGADVGGSQTNTGTGKRKASWWKKTKAQPATKATPEALQRPREQQHRVPMPNLRRQRDE